MYEEVEGAEVLEALRRLSRCAARQGYAGVAVRHGPRLQAWLFRGPKRPQHSVDFLSWAEISAGTTLALDLRFASLGSVVYEQRKGVPIGGLISGAAAELLLGDAER
eukprot:15453490-Alexandrium_andersonii.AAC.1